MWKIFLLLICSFVINQYSFAQKKNLQLSAGILLSTARSPNPVIDNNNKGIGLDVSGSYNFTKRSAFMLSLGKLRFKDNQLYYDTSGSGPWTYSSRANPLYLKAAYKFCADLTNCGKLAEFHASQL